jgi:hypothetical protein
MTILDYFDGSLIKELRREIKNIQFQQEYMEQFEDIYVGTRDSFLSIGINYISDHYKRYMDTWF